MKLIPAPLSLTYSGMRKRTLLLLACCIGLSGGLSCTTRQAPSSQPPASQADADAKAKKLQAAADAKAKKEKEAADAKATKEAAEKARKEKAAQTAEQRAQAAHDQAMAAAAAKAKKEKDAADAKALKKAKDDAAREAKAQKSKPTAPESASLPGMTTSAPVPATAANAPSAKEQKLNDLNHRYINNQVTPLQYQVERAKILAEP